MNALRPDTLKPIEVILTDVRAMKGSVEQLIHRFRQAIENPERRNRQSGAYWRHVAFTDALVRLRIFLEQNFNYIESIGLLALTRYVFELTVWLKLMQKDSQYGFVYYRQILDKQLDYYKALRDHLTREVVFLREVGAQEERLMDDRLKEAVQISDPETHKEALRHLIDDVEKEVDDRAARKFSLYGEQARTNGYNFQLYLIETKVLPGVAKSIADLEHELRRFELDSPPEAKSLPRQWRWKDQATAAGMDDEYAFIYSYTSRLLHATPVSLTTDHKNLEPDEMRIFLKYIHIRLRDIIEMAEQLVAPGPSVVN